MKRQTKHEPTTIALTCNGDLFKLPDGAFQVAEWLTDFERWSRDDFIQEAESFILSVHGASFRFDRHLLAMLADMIETYADCCRILRTESIVVQQNSGVTTGAHPAVGIRERAAIRITALMSELRITPRARAEASKPAAESGMTAFLRGPKGFSPTV